MLQVWSSIEDVAGPQLRTKIGVIEVKSRLFFTHDIFLNML